MLLGKGWGLGGGTTDSEVTGWKAEPASDTRHQGARGAAPPNDPPVGASARGPGARRGGSGLRGLDASFGRSR